MTYWAPLSGLLFVSHQTTATNRRQLTWKHFCSA